MELIDKVKGALVGFAFGDALGVGAEFMTHQEVQTYYPDGLKEFSQIIRDAHRVQFKRGQWTNDTEILIYLLEGIIQEKGFKLQTEANMLNKWLWAAHVDIYPRIRLVCGEPGWVDSPIATAHRVWEENHFKMATNEAIQRAVVTGLGCEPNELAECTRQIVLMTHDDTRCVSTVLILAKMINCLLYKDRGADYDKLLDICEMTDTRTTPFLQKARSGEIDSLEIDDEETQMWARKSMAAALWGFWHGRDAADAIYKVVNLGGDSNSNASLTGALVGLKYGYDALPAEKEKIIGLEKIIDLAERLTEVIKPRFNNRQIFNN